MIAWFISVVVLLGLGLCSQPSAPRPIAAPLRELPWGQLNFLHTTDVHGWWSGHLQEPQYSADWGDYISFAKHLRDRADAEGSDLLLIDTGDRIEGNGLYDASDPKGQYTYDIAKQQHIDLISSGNHELYKVNSSQAEFYHTIPNYKGNYLASNLDIYNPETGELEPLALRYKKFNTKNQGIRILAFSFIFDFTGNANNTVVHTVKDTVEKSWFKKAIRDRDVDLIIVFGHVDIRSHEYATVFSAIRAVHSDVPIQFFGGHSHIRDYKVYDAKSVALESGRYMETIGFMSINGLPTKHERNASLVLASSELTFSRLYIDNNLFSLHHHSGKNAETYPTDLGFNVSIQIHAARNALHLDELFGCAPKDLWVNRAPYPHPESIFSWLEEQVLPDQVSQTQRVKEGRKVLVITNTGSIRFDIFKGPLTKDSTFLVSPFTSGLRYIKDVPYTAASRVLELLNTEGPIADMMNHHKMPIASPEQVAMKLRSRYSNEYQHRNLERHLHNDQIILESDIDLIPGYTTRDDVGNDGDDTIHSPIIYYNVPNCVQAAIGFTKSPVERVDLAYNEFIEPWVMLALKFLGEAFTEKDSTAYLDGKPFTTIITDWVREHWNTDRKSCR